MLEGTSISEETEARPPEAILANGHETLEQRVYRLEKAVATLEDTARLETRIADRVTTRLRRSGRGSRSGSAEPAEGTETAPAAVLNPPDQGPADAAAAAAAAAPVSTWRGLWVLIGAYAEVQTIVRMFFDKGYRPSWVARIVPIILFFAILTSWYWVPLTSISFIGTVLDKIIDIALAFLAFKILSWEAGRYRAVLASQGNPLV